MYIAPNISGESFGIILAEAMASGAAIVASDIPAFSDLLNQGTFGLLFRTGDSSALANAISDLIQSPNRVEQLTKQAVIKANELDWSVIASQILAVYEVAMAGHGRVVLGSENSSWKRG
jgi:phosphatidylinositol alpha-mannosyltransferase